jgi:hypothetical protein
MRVRVRTQGLMVSLFHRALSLNPSSFIDMGYLLLAVVAMSAFLTGCASNPTFPLALPSSEQQGEVTVFRESRLVAVGVTLTVGVDGRAFANVGNGQKVMAKLSDGIREIYVQARGAEPTKVRINLSPGSFICLRASANYNTLAKGLVPIALIATGYSFHLDEVPCPPSAEIEKYSSVIVSYQ